MHGRRKNSFLLLVLFLLLIPMASHGEPAPVLVGFDSERGHAFSTSDEAIRTGILIAMEEINQAGGVLGGRPLELVEKDNRSVPARGVQNIEEFANLADLVAVFCGKFSPVVLEELPALHRLNLPLLDPWAAATAITENGYRPNYVFRLSLRDDWAMETLLNHALARNLRRLGLLLPNNAWGRSVRTAADKIDAHRQELSIVDIAWYNWGDPSLMEPYRALLGRGVQGVLLVSNEPEGALLVRELAELPPEQRRPILSHWGVSGGPFAQMVGAEALEKVDFTLVQTFSFLHRETSLSRRVARKAMELLGVASPRALPSPVGLAHAYDLTRMLAQALHLAGSTDRAKVREALEQINPTEGLLPVLRPPFTPERHDALDPASPFMARVAKDGAYEPMAP